MGNIWKYDEQVDMGSTMFYPYIPCLDKATLEKKQKGMKLGEEIGSKSARLGNSEGKNGSGSIRG